MQSKNEQITSLIELNEELENYFQNTIIPQLFVDAQLVLRKFTPPAMKQFTLKPEHIGQPLDDLVNNFRIQTVIDDIKQVIDTGEILEKEVQTTDFNWFQMNIIPYRMRKVNKTNGVIVTFVDITNRIQDLKELEKLIADHELLLDTIAHDIKNPLLGLSMTVEVIKKLPEQGTGKFPALLGNMERGLNKMKQVIYDLIDSRWKGHRYQAAEELLDLQSILEDVRLSLAQQILETGAKVKTDICTSKVTFTRRKLRSIVYNLVNNAIKYRSTDRIPEIFIRSYKENEYILIQVSDNGIGIKPENQGLIFKKFHQVQDSAEGNGVGLYLVKEILERSGGKISVESGYGTGSTFKVFLPLKKEIPI